MNDTYCSVEHTVNVTVIQYLLNFTVLQFQVPHNDERMNLQKYIERKFLLSVKMSAYQ